MKKFFLLLVGAVMISASYAQVVSEGEAALVYYSPKTTIHLDFTYSVEVFERGEYADFAEPMLGIADAVTENSSHYTLRDVRVGTSVSTDYERPHKVVSEPGMPMLLSINDKGLLVGYNLPFEAGKPNPDKHHPHGPKQACPAPLPPMQPHVAPYPEEVLEAATPLAQANAIAKQIFHLRETRMYLLNGEVEHAPADGESMRLVLEELDKQERALTELFVGKRMEKIEHKTISMEPSDKEQVWFFSEENGFTEPDNIDADTIRVHMDLHAQAMAANGEKKKKGSEVSQIVYNLPGNADVTVTFDGRILGQRTVPVAQFGIDVPLAKELFKGPELPVIRFNEKTGNIVSISK